MKRFQRRSARMNIMHFRVLVRRYFKQIFTNIGNFLPLLLEAPLLVLIVYIVCKKDSFIVKAAHTLTAANVTLFLLVVMAALMGILNSYREICKERDALSREVFGGLDIPAYVLSKSFVLSVIGAVQCILLFSGSLLFLDFAFPHPLTAYPLCLLALILTNISVTNLGLYISAVLKKSESAILPVLIVIILQVVFCDNLIPLDGAARLICYVTPSAWGIAVFGHACGLNEWAPEVFFKDFYSYNPVIPFLVLAAFSFLFLFLTVVRLKKVYRLKD